MLKKWLQNPPPGKYSPRHVISIFDAKKTIGEILGLDAVCTGEHQIGMRIDENQKVVLCLKAEDGKVYEALIENLPEELL